MHRRFPCRCMQWVLLQLSRVHVDHHTFRTAAAGAATAAEVAAAAAAVDTAAAHPALTAHTAHASSPRNSMSAGTRYTSMAFPREISWWAAAEGGCVGAAEFTLLLRLICRRRKCDMANNNKNEVGK